MQVFQIGGGCIFFSVEGMKKKHVRLFSERRTCFLKKAYMFF